MKLLAIDTATDACSVALQVGDEIVERHQVAPRQHTRILLPMVAELLAECAITLVDLDALVLGRGPGSFTGLRIAAGVVQGLAFSVDRPVVLVSTLAILAQPWVELGHRAVVATLDARMGEVYWGAFRADDQDLPQPADEERVLPPTQVRLPSEGAWIGVGTGFAAHEAMVAKLPGLVVQDTASLPRARNALPLAVRDFERGLALPAEQALPVYLRNRVALTEAERSRA